MTNYIDKIMTNHIFNSESSEDLYYLYSEKQNKTQIGGTNDISTEPRGGFPPIFIVNRDNKLIEKTKNRELVLSKTSVSIKDILNQIKQNKNNETI